jgi:hypothetical protein
LWGVSTPVIALSESCIGISTWAVGKAKCMHASVVVAKQSKAKQCKA